MRIDIRTLSLLICEIFDLEDITKVANPDGRWELLQAWLKSRPRWQKKINQWVAMTPEQAYDSLREWVSIETALPLSMLKAFISEEVGAQIKAALGRIQTLYSNRASAPKRLEPMR